MGIAEAKAGPDAGQEAAQEQALRERAIGIAHPGLERHNCGQGQWCGFPAFRALRHILRVSVGRGTGHYLRERRQPGPGAEKPEPRNKRAYIGAGSVYFAVCAKRVKRLMQKIKNVAHGGFSAEIPRVRAQESQ